MHSRRLALTMKNYYAPMLPDVAYHVYNRANSNRDLLFTESRNYDFFLQKYAAHLAPALHTYVYCLLPNHFHLLVKVKPEKDIRAYLTQHEKWYDWLEKPIATVVSEMFRRFFISYAKAFNLQQKRRGSLFEKDFKRLPVNDNDAYFTALVYYIHSNPAHHKIRTDFENYPWSSYRRILDPRKTLLQKEFVLEWFGGIKNYVELHEGAMNSNDIVDLLIE